MLECARNICCSARKLLGIYAARLGSARIFLENELLENARLEFYFPCSKSSNTFNLIDYLACSSKFSVLNNLSWIASIMNQLYIYNKF